MKKQLTILQVISQRHLSGAERVCLMLSEALQSRGHRIVLLCKKNGAMLDEAARRGIETRAPGLSGKFNPLVATRILAIAREVGADLIHTHLSTASQWGGVAGRIGGIPVISHVHAMNSRYFFMPANLMIACSDGVRQHILSQGVSPDKIITIYNGIDAGRFESVSEAAVMREILKIDADTPMLVCIAHLAAKKGQASLIKAIARLKDKWTNIQCYLAGIGENKGALQQLAETLGVSSNIHLLGFRTDAIALMKTADIVMLPSLGKEGLPLVLLEAALLAKPSICSDIPGNNEVVVRNETGLLFPPGNDEALAGCIDKMLSNPQLQKQMGTMAKERASTLFTIEAMAERIEAAYYKIIGTT